MPNDNLTLIQGAKQPEAEPETQEFVHMRTADFSIFVRNVITHYSIHAITFEETVNMIAHEFHKQVNA